MSWITATVLRVYFSRKWIGVMELLCMSEVFRSGSSPWTLISFKKLYAFRIVEAEFVAWNEKWFLNCTAFSHVLYQMVSKTIFIHVNGSASTKWTMFKGSSVSNCIYGLFAAIWPWGRLKNWSDFPFQCSRIDLIQFVSKNALKRPALALGFGGKERKTNKGLAKTAYKIWISILNNIMKIFLDFQFKKKC